MDLVVVGASGFIGRHLVAALSARGDSVRVVGRDPRRLDRLFPRARRFAWDPAAGPLPADAVAGCDAVVNLAGEGVADRAWTPARKTLLRASRLDAARGIVRAIEALGAGERPAAFLQGSAIGYYGERGEAELDESSTPGDNFLAWICRDLEAEARRAADVGTRVVVLRTGIVLGVEGGALPRLVLPFRLFVGGPLGNGRQWMSWIHRRDQIGLILHALDRREIAGALNLTAPRPARNVEVARAIGVALGRPAIMPTPRFALRLALGERVDFLLGSERVLPRAALASGYAFAFPEIGPALRDLLATG
ncbi:MAG: TIGR01777 family protein [Chloroflexi bacterium]|nr:TIGR01777 family protein [Chloroflexota bacterium]